MNKYIQTAVFFLLLSFFTNFTLGQALATTSTNKIDEALSFFKPNEPGGTVLVAKDGEIIYQKAFGKANLELDIDVKLNSKFGVASVTKPFTAVAILKLADKKKLSLKDDITKYVKDYPTHGHTITIEHLLTHTSGISNYNDNFQEFLKIERNEYSRTELIDLFKDKPMNFAPGEKYTYNNSGYFLLGYIIEIVSGKSYGEFLNDEFFKPLGMKHTELNSSEKLIRNRAVGYDLLSNKGYTNRKYESETFTTSPAGGIISTVYDLHLWYAALMDYKIISKEMLEKASIPYKLNNGKFGRTGLGWFTGNLLDSEFIAHDGRTWGAAASLVYLPKEKIFVVALSNCSYCSWNAGNFYYSPFRISSILMEKEYSAEKGLTKETLSNYEAVYESSLGETRTIITDGKNLSLRHSNGRLSQISGYENDLFYVEDTYETLKFNKDSSGKITSLTSNKRIPITFKRTDKKLPPKSLSRSVLNRVLEKGIIEGLEFYKKSKTSDTYYVNESELNNVGYALLQNNRVGDAIEIFKLNVAEFPNSANAYDSLGEAYFTNKKLKISLKNYKKSLELNPKNNNAKAMIIKIEKIIKK